MVNPFGQTKHFHRYSDSPDLSGESAGEHSSRRPGRRAGERGRARSTAAPRGGPDRPDRRRARPDRAVGMATLRQGPPPCRPELRRLPRLRPSGSQRRAAPLQRPRLPPNRHPGRHPSNLGAHTPQPGGAAGCTARLSVSSSPSSRRGGPRQFAPPEPGSTAHRNARPATRGQH